MKAVVRWALRAAGYDLVPAGSTRTIRRQNPDITDAEWSTWLAVEPYTMTSLDRILAAIRATAYIVQAGIPGDVVECGVWRGGSSMAIAHTLLRLGDSSRTLFLFDTFEGMTEPRAEDVSHAGRTAEELLTAARSKEAREESTVWAYASIEDVTANLTSTGYPQDRIRYVKGPVEQTIPGVLPDSIALLRLDTDWYESTRHELTHLYPRLRSGGVLIIDDYGHWQGARRAVDEHFGGAGPFLHRIDYTGRLVVKR